MIDMRNKACVNQKLPWGGHLGQLFNIVKTASYSFCFHQKSCFRHENNSLLCSKNHIRSPISHLYQNNIN